MAEGGGEPHPHVPHYRTPVAPVASDPGEACRERAYVEGADQRMLYRRFALQRHVLALLATVTGVAFFVWAVSGIVVCLDAWGESEVNLLRMTEGGEPVHVEPASYATFAGITVLMTVLVACAAVAAVLHARRGLFVTAWTALAVVFTVGAVLSLVALAGGADAVDPYLLTATVCYAVMAAAAVFELWRARWVRARRMEGAASSRAT